MAPDNYTAAGLMKFLKEAAMAGLINPATARSRRNAAENLLEKLHPEESDDLRKVDVDDLCSRFVKLQGSTIRTEALQIYRDRLAAALEDYFRYLDNPQTFSSGGGEQRALRKRSAGNQRSEEETALEQIKLGIPERPAEILPVPIRDDRVVFIQNLPLDLTHAEADRLSRVILALAEKDSP